MSLDSHIYKIRSSRTYILYLSVSAETRMSPGFLEIVSIPMEGVVTSKNVTGGIEKWKLNMKEERISTASCLMRL